ncbi:MAG: hypothetical protein RL011_2373 [Pseudomonadota bacterium]|jgi:hypothetical protein
MKARLSILWRDEFMIREILNSLLTAILSEDNYWIIMLFAIFVFLGLWSALTGSRLSYIIRGPAATKLFLGVQLQRAAKPEMSGGLPEISAHVVDIDLAHVMFISHSSFSRGEKLTMSFAKVPDFESVTEPYQVTVASCRSLKGTPGSFLVKAHFTRMAPTMRLPLRAFIGQLSRRHNLFPAH